MLAAIFLILTGTILLVVGGEGTVRGGSSLAGRLKISPYVIGATIVAFGTSAPELVVTVTASFKDAHGLALGNVIGSNIANLGLILGLAALVNPPRLSRKTFYFELPVALLVILVTIVFTWDGKVGRPGGIVLLLLLVASTLRSINGSNAELLPDWINKCCEKLDLSRLVNHSSESTTEEDVVSTMDLKLSIVYVLAGISALIFGGNLLVKGAVTIAKLLGVSDWVIGSVIVAVGTSLPEVAASVSAAWHGRGDLAIGNVLGSNAFNVLFVLGTGASIKPILVQDIIHLDLVLLGVMTLFTLAVLNWSSHLKRWTGVVLLFCYGLYIAKNLLMG